MIDEPVVVAVGANWLPAHAARLPALLYRNVEPFDDGDMAITFGNRFRANGWPPLWQGTLQRGIDYVSRTHEVIGVVSGTATLQIGGDWGRHLPLDAGDALLLPAGSKHYRLDRGSGFEIVIAAPQGRAGGPVTCGNPEGSGAPFPQKSLCLADPVRGATHRLSHNWCPAP